MTTRKTTTKKTTTRSTAKTSTTSKTTAKPKTTKTTTTTAAAAPKTTTAKSAPVKPATPVVVSKTTPTSVSPEMKKKELIEKVVKLSGVKKRDVKPTVEAMLQVLGEAITEGRELSLEPLGKMKVNRAKQTSSHRISVVKLRQKSGAASAASDTKAEPLAPAAE